MLVVRFGPLWRTQIGHPTRSEKREYKDIGASILQQQLNCGVSVSLLGTVTDVVDRVGAGHLLLLQEMGGGALVLGEDRDQEVGAGHLLASRGQHVDNGAL